MTKDPRLPVTVLSGFLGAGKTTLRNGVLNSRDCLCIGFIVNDMVQGCIDADLIRAARGMSQTQMQDTLGAMLHGCICYTLRTDRPLNMRRLAQDRRSHYLLIEPTGISEPLPAATIVEFAVNQGAILSDVVRLDGIVKVADAANLTTDFSATDTLSNRTQVTGEGDARIFQTDHSPVAPCDIVNTCLFNFDPAYARLIWVTERNGHASNGPETKEDGAFGFVHRARQPFKPCKIVELLNDPLPGVIRVKGCFWFAMRPDWVVAVSLARTLLLVWPLGRWCVSVPRDRWPTRAEGRAYPDAHWPEPFGDQQQELVFIDTGMDQDHIRARLDACPLDEEWGDNPADWTALPGVAVALWHRTTGAVRQSWMEALPSDRLRQTLRLQDAAALLDRVHRRAMVDQVAGLQQHAARHMGALLITLRVVITNGQSCYKWHLDAVRARLPCTLRGKGPQFGPTNRPMQVDRVHPMSTGTVALLCRSSWGTGLTGILHRSPPTAPGQMRLLMVFDQVNEGVSC